MSDPKAGFSKALVDWYLQNYRRLPWRETTDPYRIWLSEVMLQQTQVATVIPYYEKFLSRFPTLQDLAAAPVDAVLKAWEGLGYYVRCRNLHKAAGIMVSAHEGRFPDTLEAVNALPGIGQSTAGAILTFAMGQRHPLLDGNVKRVLTRLYDMDQDPALPAVQKDLWQKSSDLLEQAEDAYAFNQAVMELGAVICTPKNPACLVCPVRSFCDAAKAGTQHERPVKGLKKPLPHYPIGAAVIWHKGRVLIQQRPKEGLLGGLWEFPGGKQEPGETLPETVQREIREELDIDIAVGEKLVAVKHAYTHFRITLHAFQCCYLSGTPVPRCADDWAWVRPEELTHYAFPKANNRVIEEIHEGIRDGRICPEKTEAEKVVVEAGG